MKTIMRTAFEALAAEMPCHPWVLRQLRHLLARSTAGTRTYQPRRKQ